MSDPIEEIRKRATIGARWEGSMKRRTVPITPEERDTLLAEIDRLREALEDIKNREWHTIPGGPTCRERWPEKPKLWCPGCVATEALKGGG